MRLPIIVRENKIAFAVGTVIVLLGAFFAYLAAVNPTWSPVASLRGDGNGVSNSQKQAEAKEEAEERLRGALQFVPATAVMATHANLSAVEGGQEWWTYYNRFTPPSYSLPSELPEELGVTSITYASFPTQVQDYTQESPFSDVIVLTAPQEKGEAVLAHVNAENNGMTYAHYTHDEEQAYVIISDMPGYETISNLVLDDATDAETFAGLARAKDFTVDSGSPTMYVDMSRYLDTITQALPEKQGFVDTLFGDGMGLADQTTWLGSSPDKGITWEGDFLSGGIDTDKVSTTAFNTAIAGEMQFLSADGLGSPDLEASGPDGVFESGYVLEGLSTVSEAISFSKGEEVAGQIINPHDADATPVTAEAPQGDEDVVIVFSPQMFLSSFHGIIKPFAVHTVTLRVTDDKSTLSFDFYGADDYAEETVEGTTETQAPVAPPSEEEPPVAPQP